MCFSVCICSGLVLLGEGWVLGAGRVVEGFVKQILLAGCGEGVRYEGQSHRGLSGVSVQGAFREQRLDWHLLIPWVHINASKSSRRMCSTCVARVQMYSTQVQQGATISGSPPFFPCH